MNNKQNNSINTKRIKLERYSIIERSIFKIEQYAININEEWFVIMSNWIKKKESELKENYILSIRIVLQLDNKVMISTEYMVFRGDIEKYIEYIYSRILFLSSEYGTSNESIENIIIDYYIINNIEGKERNNLRNINDIVYGKKQKVVYGESRKKLIIEYLKNNNIQRVIDNADFNRIIYKLYRNDIILSNFVDKKVCEEGNSYLYIKEDSIEEYRNDILKTRMELKRIEKNIKVQYIKFKWIKENNKNVQYLSKVNTNNIKTKVEFNWIKKYSKVQYPIKVNTNNIKTKIEFNWTEENRKVNIKNISEAKIKFNQVENYHKARYLTKVNKLNNNYYKLMVFDIETYVDENNEHRIYHIGYCVFNKNSSDRKYAGFYITDYKSESDLIYFFFKSIMKNKYNNFLIYGHNSIQFDMKLIFEVAIDYYEVVPIIINKTVLGYKIKKDDIEIIFKDSFLMLPQSLKNLGLAFNTFTLKSDFPHKLITKDRLFNDTGELPSRDNYFNIDKDVYEKEVATLKEFNIKVQSKKYLKNDLDCLMDCLIEFNQTIFMNYKVNPFQHFTLSGLALKIFRSNYYKAKTIVSLPKSLNDELREGYAGGIVNVYKPRFKYSLKRKEMYCYDVNSLYPFIMLQEFAGGDYTDTKFLKPVQFNNDWNGVCWAEVKCDESMERPFLTTKRNGVLIQPTGEFEGIYTTNEIKYAISLGYDIKVNRVLNFCKTCRPFETYVNDIYKKKSNPMNRKSSRFIYKLLLNTLYGVMGASQDRTEIKILWKMDNELAEILATKKVINQTEINDWVIITYESNISTTESQFEGLETIKNYEENFSNVFIGMDITAKARIHMHKFTMYCAENGIEDYYTDTDSIFTDKSISNKFIGDEIGKLKLEHTITDAIFLGPKVYAIKLDTGKEIVKFKGISRDTISFDTIENIYNNETKFKLSQKRIFSKTKYNRVSTKTIEMNFDSNFYTKGKIILSKDGVWVATKPFHLIKE